MNRILTLYTFIIFSLATLASDFVCTSSYSVSLATVFSDTSSSAPSRAEWLAGLPDAMLLNRLSLPGAHDCATGNGFRGFSAFVGPRMGKTQDKTLDEQWDCGIRVFDLRPHLNGSCLRNNHGVLATKLLFDESLNVICRILSAHPTEFAVVIFQEEKGSASTHDAWAQKVTEVLHSDAFAPYVVDYRPTLTLGDLRGRILILARNDYGTTPVGACLSGWSFSADVSRQPDGIVKGAFSSGTFRVQDFYDVTANGAVEQKLSAITAMLELAQQNAPRNHTLYINHSSGYTTPASTNGNRNNAQNCNTHLLNLLADGQHSGPTGIVMMDFAGADKSGNYNTNGQALIDAIIATNSCVVNNVTLTMSISQSTSSSAPPLRSLYTDCGILRLYRPNKNGFARQKSQTSIRNP